MPKQQVKEKAHYIIISRARKKFFDAVINQEMDDFFITVKTAVNKQVDASEMMKAYIVTKIKTLKTKVNLYRFALESDLQPEAINDLFIKLKKSIFDWCTNGTNGRHIEDFRRERGKCKLGFSRKAQSMRRNKNPFTKFVVGHTSV